MTLIFQEYFLPVVAAFLPILHPVFLIKRESRTCKNNKTKILYWELISSGKLLNKVMGFESSG